MTITDSLGHISAKEIGNIREQMLKFAQLQLKNDTLAEDLVQESLCDALKNLSSFKQQAALKTWIFAILKNKIIDYFRQKDRFVLESDLDDGDEVNSFFDTKGHWKEEYYPNHWQGLESAVYSKQFWLLFEACLNHLPAQQGRVFMMREYLELKTDEICQEANISISNLHVLMYRARLQLQQCLSNKLNTGSAA